MKQMVFVALAAAMLASRDGLVLAVGPTQAEIDAYVAEQTALAADLRDCDLEKDSVQYATEADDGAPYERARVRVPKSG